MIHFDLYKLFYSDESFPNCTTTCNVYAEGVDSANLWGNRRTGSAVIAPSEQCRATAVCVRTKRTQNVPHIFS